MASEQADLERRVRTLERWNGFWKLVVVLALAGLAGNHFLLSATRNTRALSGQTTAEGLRLRSVSDGPFLVTHLYYWGGGGASKRVAALPEPLMIIDSGGARIPRQQLQRLRWKNSLGEEDSAPPADGEILWQRRQERCSGDPGGHPGGKRDANGKVSAPADEAGAAGSRSPAQRAPLSLRACSDPA